MTLSHKERKQRPVLTGLLDYFPDACFEVAHCSFVCNEQHNPGQPMYWAKEKSIGQGDEIVRHLMDRKKHVRDTDGVRVLAKAAWRALELLQREIDTEMWVARIEATLLADSEDSEEIEASEGREPASFQDCG